MPFAPGWRPPRPNTPNSKATTAYTLEEFGLSKEWIDEELGPLLDHYSLSR